MEFALNQVIQHISNEIRLRNFDPCLCNTAVMYADLLEASLGEVFVLVGPNINFYSA